MLFVALAVDSRIGRLSTMDHTADLLRHGLWAILPTLDVAASLGPALAALELPDGRSIVVDGRSSDTNLAVARRAGADIVVVPRGRGAQPSAGAEAAFARAARWLVPDPLFGSKS
jgi:hypothetical protein